MTTDEFSTEMERYGVSPGIIAMIMILTSLIVPFGFIPNFGIPIFLAMIFILPYLFIPLTLLNILYALGIVRYYQAKNSKDLAVVLGLLSIILPTGLILYFSALAGYVIVIYPIPIQFIVGIFILWKFEGPEVISPWSGMRLDLSWWKRERPKRKSDWNPLEDRKKFSEEEDWLEG